ncbi:hypothetical protein UlMin_010679 [Ulmus minor]
MKKLWKGIFYCVWHANMVPVQTDLIDRLFFLAVQTQYFLWIQYLLFFLFTMYCEWNGIDVLRLDKFYLLIRDFTQFLCGRTFLADAKSLGNGVNYHIAFIFLEEMSSFFPLQLEVLDVLLVPFLSFMEKILDKVLLGKIKSNMFDVLLTKGTKLLEVKKSVENVHSGNNIVFFGSIALNMGFAGNRKVMYGLHEEVLKLERDLTSLGIDILMPDVIENDEKEVPKLIPIESTGVIGRRIKRAN